MTTGTALAPSKGLRNLLANDPFAFLPNRFNRLFEGLNAFAPFVEETFPLTTWTPVCDIFETSKEIVLRMELPGVKKEFVNVSIENNVLMIHGERKFEEEVKKEDFHRVERNYGEFLRTFTLPAYIEPNKINAEFKEGLLTVILPKRVEAMPKQIEVKVK